MTVLVNLQNNLKMIDLIRTIIDRNSAGGIPSRLTVKVDFDSTSGAEGGCDGGEGLGGEGLGGGGFGGEGLGGGGLGVEGLGG